MARRRNEKPTEQPPAIDIVSRIQRIESELSPSERRVAAMVSRDYEAACSFGISPQTFYAAGVKGALCDEATRALIDKRSVAPWR